MKKVVKILMLFLALSAFAVSYSRAQEVVVSARLSNHPREIRSAAITTPCLGVRRMGAKRGHLCLARRLLGICHAQRQW